MARTITEIKKQMTDNFIGNSYVQNMYSLDTTKTFEEQFSTVSLESILFYVIASAIFVIESLFDTHNSEVEEMLLKLVPHSRDWYREKVLRFQYPGRSLVTDKDYYDNTGLTADDILDLEIVKFCAIEENNGWLKVKVAKGAAGAREQLTTAEENALKVYIEEVQDAGVNIEIVNQQADKIYATIDIYYNALKLDPADGMVEEAFINYASTLEFNGILKYNKLIDALQNVTGVELVAPLSIQIQRAANPLEDLGVQKIAMSGYWVVNDAADLVINYKPYVYANI